MMATDFLYISLSLFVMSVIYSHCFSHFVSLQLSLSISSSASFETFFSLSISVTHTKIEVIISGRLDLKVCYHKHAAVVINFQ